MDCIEKLKDMIGCSHSIVFFGGAGVSTESGIPDFRSADGIYNRDSLIPPERILSHTFFMNDTESFFGFYKNNMIFPDARPNQAHIALAELEKSGKLRAVVTQNIDGLHQTAGSKNVFELHGSIKRNYCMNCGKFYSEEYVVSANGVPVCDECGGIVKPDVVLYEEPLDENVCMGAVKAMANADMLIIGGTSLSVYPAAGFIRYYRGNRLVIINASPTSYDGEANLLITDPIGKVFSEVMK